MQTQLQPVEAFVREGFANKVKEQFRAPAIFVSSPDKLRNLQVLLGNRPPEYPYIFMVQQSKAANPDGYASNRLARQGVPVRLSTDGHQYDMVRVIPTNFDIELTFITNKYDGGLDSVDGFSTRWLFNRRNGASLFTVNYGLANFPVSYTISDSITVPQRESPTDQESVYQVVGNILLHGWVSEPVLGTRGRVNQIVLSDTVPTLGLPNEHFISF